MTINFKGASGKFYPFEGYFQNRESLKTVQGIYSVLDNTDGKYYVKDVGQADNVYNRIKYHDREECWKRNSRGNIVFAVMYTPDYTERQRCEIESDIRACYNPTCGDR